MELSNLPPDFSVLPDRAHYRPVGQATVAQAVQMTTEAISRARACKRRKLLVDVTALTGFDPPSLSARYFFMREFAAAASGEVCIGFVVPSQMIDPEKFEITVGRNAGLCCNVFGSEAEALDWLHRTC